MKKALIKNENAKKTLLAVVFNIVVLVLFSSYILGYEVNDDFIFAEYIAAGYINIRFSNYFLFAFMSALSKVIYPLNAYTIVTLALSSVSFTVISRIMLDRFKPIVSLSITLLMYAFLGMYYYNAISFTQAPALICTAGFIAIIYYLEQKKPSGVIVGSLLVIVGSGYRVSSFYAVLIVSAVYYIAVTIAKNGESFKEFVKGIFEPKRLIVLAVTVAVCFSLNYASNTINNSTDELKYYSEYTSLRSSVWDYGVPDYETHEEEYRALDIDENDVLMLRYGLLDDNGAYPMEKLRAIKEMADKESFTLDGINLKTIAEIIGNLPETLKNIDWLNVIFILGYIAFGAFFILNKSKACLPAVLILLICAAMNFYLILIGRSIARATSTIWFPAILYLFTLYDRKNIRDVFIRMYEKKKVIFPATACLLSVAVIGFNLINSYIYFPYNESAKQKYNELHSYFTEHPENRYELTMHADIYDGNAVYNSAYFINAISPEQNYKLINFTYYNLPYDKEMCRSIFGTENLYANLLNDNVYFVALKEKEGKGLQEPMEKYLEKYYSDGKDVESEKVATVNEYDIYKYNIKNNT